MLNEVEPFQLLNLLQYEHPGYRSRGDTALDLCLSNGDKKCVRTIVNHILKANIQDIHVDLLCLVFPYIGMIAEEIVIKQVLESR